MTEQTFLYGNNVSLHCGDNIFVLRKMADASVDSIVTDPPYGLFFMGKKWDYDVPSVELWSECLRVLKPGGHLLAFAGTRTQHRMAVRIEDAGFEIRDMIAWVYGSGFPKSLDVSKAIDKAGGASPREQAELFRARRKASGMTREQVAEYCGCTLSSVRDWEEGRSRSVGAPVEFIIPSESYRAKLADLLGYSADERQLIGLTKDRRNDGTGYGLGHSGELRAGGNTDAARRWQGWGTALKPALEPICVARKPLVGTVAENVLSHGTGALNIDGCRVGTEGGTRKDAPLKRASVSAYGDGLNGGGRVPIDAGRWPANLIHDGSDDVAALAGNAARLFYCAKASRRDRSEGNTHPTVKPTDLMRYLCRLVTPPGGIVLDPFMGSGSTGKGALLEGFKFIGVEIDENYVNISRARVDSILKTMA